MINSFWNICSTCPMPKEEKLNSEYKRNYVWHPQYKPLAQDVISCAPQSISKEIGIQRRKQYPELAHRSNEVIRHDIGQCSKDSSDVRARSEERDGGQASKSGRRSRSAEPTMGHQHQKMLMIQSFPPVASGRVSMLPNTEEFPNITEQPSETSEYKSQFAWPRKTTEDAPCMARKSVSMSIIKGSDETDMIGPKTKLAPVHRPCVKHKEEAKLEKTTKDSRKLKTEYKSKYKPFTSYVYVDGQWKKTSRLVRVPEKGNENSEPWFVEVVERLQKANEYRLRGHGHPVYGELLSDIYKKPPEVPTSRSKVVAPELLVNQPKCHQPLSKRVDVSRKETVLETIVEKKKERKTSPHLRRPKSAEPAKVKEPVKQKRPATTPPAKLTTRVPSTRRRAPKDEDGTVPKGKLQTTRKPKEQSAKLQPLISSKKPQSTSSTSQSSGGKVWLQAEQSAAEPKPKDKSLVPETSDAVRPSSLSPMPAKSLPEEITSENLAEIDRGGEKGNEDVKNIVTQSSVVPLTHVRTPEEVTGVKSPDPENWTVPIESSEKLQWSGINTKEKDIVSEPSAETIRTAEEISEKLSKLTTEEPVPSSPAIQESSSNPKSSSSKLTSASVLDRARSRLDQFWGKNK